MRMRPHIDALPSQKFRRPDLIEEDEWPHHLTIRRRQCASNLKTAKVARTGNDEGINRIQTDFFRTGWCQGGIPTHAYTPLRCEEWARLPIRLRTNWPNPTLKIESNGD